LRGRRAHGNFWGRFLFVAAAAAVLGALAQAKFIGHSRISDQYDVKKVVIDLGSNVRVKPAVSRHFPSGSESFETMVKRLKPLAAINGTYYDERNRPLGDIVIEGQVVKRGAQRHAFAITQKGEIRFVEKPKGKQFNWTGYRAALACGPRLVHDGKPSVDPEKDGFRPAARRIAAWRSAVAKTKDNKLLLVVVENSITLDEMAAIMIDLGAVDAMNLDGGGACGLYYDGRYLSRPALPMTNILAVYRK
jgi:exopolysaccharide biosynthesis protein